MASPSWFIELTTAERTEFARLFRKATGLELVLPPVEGESPASWISTIARDTGNHVRHMEQVTSQMSDVAKRQYIHDPLKLSR